MEEEQVNPNAVWDESRCKEYEMLETLLSEVSSLNRGNHVIERMQKCIDIAERLNSTNLDSGRMCFRGFLHRQIIKDRFPDENKAKAEPADEETMRRVCAAVSDALGDAYDCDRVWSAWSYGTMGPDDFWLVRESDDRLREIAGAAISAMIPPFSTDGSEVSNG